MITRVTNRSLALGSLTNMQASMSRTNKLQEQLSSGQVLSRPSDDPVVTNNSMQYRTEIAVNDQYTRNNNDGQAWLSIQDTALQDGVKTLQRVRDLAVQAANTGAGDATSRKAIAVEVKQLRESLFGTANTEYLGRPVFGGTTDGIETAFSQTGGVVGYDGNTGAAAAITRRVGPDVDVQVNVVGTEVFGSGGTVGGDTFAMLSALESKLTSGSSEGVGDFITHTDAALTRVKDSLAVVGARTNQLTALKETSEARSDQLTDANNEITAVDVPKSLIEYNLQKSAYEAALAVTAKVIQPTLMDFLR